MNNTSSTYITGTITKTGTLVTGSGATFTADMVGAQLYISSVYHSTVLYVYSSTQLGMSALGNLTAGTSYQLRYSGMTRNGDVFATSNAIATQSLIAASVNTGQLVNMSNGSVLSLPTSVDTLVGRATVDTLTNKTLTAPVMSSFVNSTTFTLPSADGSATGKLVTNGSGTLSFSQSGLIASGNINTASLLACFTTPVQLVAAPGAGKTIIVESAAIELVNGTTKFTGGGNPFLQFGATYTQLNTATNVLTSASNITSGTAVSTSYVYSAPGMTGADVTGSAYFPLNAPVATNIVNKSLCFTCLGANLATGNGSINYWVKYSIVSNFT